MVAAVRSGKSLRSVAREFHVSLLTVQRWVERAAGRPLDQVDWSDRSSAPSTQARQIPEQTQELIVAIRCELKRESDLGEFGAEAIRQALSRRGHLPLPSVRTINRVLARRGAQDAARRTRRMAPPAGWHLPDVVAGDAELDEWDVVEGLVLRGAVLVEVLNVVSLHGGLVGSWPCSCATSERICNALVSHWQQVGLPGYAQFDNDSRFAGTHKHPDSIGSVVRMCLRLGVVPVFAPPREMGFQAGIEGYNGRWQAKVWARYEHASMEALQAQSQRYVAASRERSVVRIDAAPKRRAFPEIDPSAEPAPASGRIIFIRRTSETGDARILGRNFAIDALWPRRLVRCELDLNEAVIRCYRLRRREPFDQPMIREIPYILPKRMLDR